MSSPVIAVPANPALDESIEAFHRALTHNGKGAEAYVQFMGRLTDRLIGLFLLEAVEIANVSSTQRKIVDFAVDTGSKASSMLTSQIYKKLSNAQFAKIERDLKAMYWPAGDDNGNVPQLFFAIDATFARDYQTVIDICADGKGTTRIDLILRVLDRQLEEILQQFFLAQAKHVDIGFLTRKALDVAIAGTRSACQAVMHKVVKNFNDAQLKDFMSHYAQVYQQK